MGSSCPLLKGSLYFIFVSTSRVDGRFTTGCPPVAELAQHQWPLNLFAVLQISSTAPIDAVPIEFDRWYGGESISSQRLLTGRRILLRPSQECQKQKIPAPSQQIPIPFTSVLSRTFAPTSTAASPCPVLPRVRPW